LCVNHILKFASESQKDKWLPNLASGKWIGSWGLTEPNTGSDAMRMKCVAEKDGDYWILNGSKNFITHGISSDIIVVIVRTGELLDSHGMTAFAVERGTKGFNAGKKEDKLGMRASETAEVIFDNCRVHKDNILGRVGEGFIQSMKILDGGRISIGAMALGMAEGAMNAAVDYSKQREQFGKAISKFQGISFKLADMATEIEASRLLLYKAAHHIKDPKNSNYFSAIAKYKASEVAVAVANDAVQVFGGYGYIKEFPVEKFYRDSKLSTIGEGTSEIQKLVISRAILKN
jgi:alkylation response protein AidB-like acyl-CoA dehydrogenase